MKLIPPAAAALAAFALSACQDKVAEVEHTDPAVAAAVADVHGASFDPVTGKARDAARGFAATPQAPAAAGAPPPNVLGDRGVMGRTLEARPTESIGGETAF